MNWDTVKYSKGWKQPELTKRECVAKSKKAKKKLTGPQKAALIRGDVLPASVLKGKKIPRSVKAAFMKASVEKARKADEGNPYDPRVYMPRKGDSFLYRETPGSVHSAIDQLMADAAAVNQKEAAAARERKENKRHQEPRPNAYGDTPDRVVKSVSLMNVGPGIYGRA
jgi:hypothetical protein